MGAEETLAAYLAGPARAFEKPVVNLPTWRNAGLRFFERAAWEDIELDLDLDRNDHGGLGPFARISSGSEFLAADVSSPACPLRTWDHERGKFVAAFDDFSSFVAAVREK